MAACPDFVHTDDIVESWQSIWFSAAATGAKATAAARAAPTAARGAMNLVLMCDSLSVAAVGFWFSLRLMTSV
jgi:hypothetical protein